MQPADTPFKQFLLSCLSSPQTRTFATQSDAHRARWAFYGALRQLRREGDPWGDTKDLLEAIVRETDSPRACPGDGCPGAGGPWELRIQRKTTNVMELFGSFAPANTLDPPPPSAAEDPALLRRLEILDWAATTPAESYPALMAAIATFPDIALPAAKLRLRELGLLPPTAGGRVDH